MKPININRGNPLRAGQCGLSIVELMIALSIGLLLLLGISTLVVQQNSTRTEMDKSSRQIENGRYAMQLLNTDIQLAGYYGEYSPPLPPAVLMTTPNPCVTIGNLGWNNNAALLSVPVPIFGFAGAGADPTGCLDNYQPNTAVLVIRRVSTASNPVASVVAGNTTTFLQVSRCRAQAAITPFVLGTGGFILRDGNCLTAAPGTVANLRPYIVRIYYISSCSVCGSDTIPTLKMLEFVGGNQSPVPLVEGVENMQFEYGIDNVAGPPPAGCLADIRDGAPDVYSSAPDAAQWQDVMTVRVHLLARNDDITPGHTDNKLYNLGPTAPAFAPGGSFKRHVYSQLMRAANPSGRRETCLLPP